MLRKRKRITVCFLIAVSIILTLSACNQTDQVNDKNTEEKDSNTVTLDKDDKKTDSQKPIENAPKTFKELQKNKTYSLNLISIDKFKNLMK